MDTKDSQIEFLRINGVAIAACAWNGYKANGRGMVCVLSDLENEVLLHLPFDFMPEIEASKFIKPWYGCKEARMVSGYDPQKEVVVCFIRRGQEDNTDIDSYKLITRPAPPDAAED